MAEQDKILFKEEDLISEKDLLRYLDEKTPEVEKNAIEEKASENSFESDALEGLQQINPERIKSDVRLLNQKLQQHLHAKKHRNDKGKIKDLQWILVAIIILLFICIVGYLIIRLHAQNSFF